MEIRMRTTELTNAETYVLATLYKRVLREEDFIQDPIPPQDRDCPVPDFLLANEGLLESLLERRLIRQIRSRSLDGYTLTSAGEQLLRQRVCMCRVRGT